MTVEEDLEMFRKMINKMKRGKTGEKVVERSNSYAFYACLLIYLYPSFRSLSPKLSHEGSYFYIQNTGVY